MMWKEIRTHETNQPMPDMKVIVYLIQTFKQAGYGPSWRGESQVSHDLKLAQKFHPNIYQINVKGWSSEISDHKKD
jgi:hypothetical protein